MLSGDLPVLLENGNLEEFVSKIEDNQVRLVLVDKKDYAQFTITAQTVNSLGETGPESEQRSAEAEVGSGCSAIGKTNTADASPWMLMMFAIGVFSLRRQRR